MEDVDEDKPLIVGKPDRNKPVKIDLDINFEGETKDIIEDRT